MDKNGYNPSIVQDIEQCILCGRRTGKLDRHEVFHGAYRSKSKKLGCWVWLCHEHHMQLHQKTPDLDKNLKMFTQNVAMTHYGWTVEEFRHEFGKSYL